MAAPTAPAAAPALSAAPPATMSSPPSPPPALAPNPFPANAPAASAQRTDKATAEPRYEKPSLVTEPADARTSNAPLPEVRDAVPSYPNEVRSSIPLPGTYISPRAPARDSAQSGAGGATGRTSAQSARKEEALQRRSFEGQTSMVSPAHRDPAEWIKAIQKLRSEGRLEQVTRELAEFRKTFPAYVLPDDLKALAPK